MSPDRPTRDSATDSADPREVRGASAGESIGKEESAGKQRHQQGGAEHVSAADGGPARRAELGGQAAGSPHSGGHREEKGGSTSNCKHPPHVTEGSEHASVQGKPGGQGTPVLPANAQGTDRVSTGENAQAIDDESMYDRRPGEHKNRPPSSE
jgi:hypothetical protein